MKDVCKKIYCWIALFLKTIISFLSVLLFSSFNAAKKIKLLASNNQYDNCVILGNGPSLKPFLEDNLDDIRKYKTVAVNLFCASSQFFDLKPSYYVLTDPCFFDEGVKSERILTLQSDVKTGFSSVDWKMILFLPSMNKGSKLVKQISNDNITVCFYNLTPIDGFLPIQKLFFKKNLGMPTAMTVVNAAIFLMINIGFKNIYLVGADHNMIRNIYVNDNNELMLKDEHFNGVRDLKIDYSISKYVEGFCVCMKTHERLSEYAKSQKVNIWNSTKGSFIDAYPRKNLI